MTNSLLSFNTIITFLLFALLLREEILWKKLKLGKCRQANSVWVWVIELCLKQPSEQLYRIGSCLPHARNFEWRLLIPSGRKASRCCVCTFLLSLRCTSGSLIETVPCQFRVQHSLCTVYNPRMVIKVNVSCCMMLFSLTKTH